MSKDNEKIPDNNDFSDLKADVKAGFAAIEQQMTTIFNTLTKIDHTINGNGQPGLVEKVARLEERLQGTWKTLIILGWIANFLVGIAALATAILLRR